MSSRKTNFARSSTLAIAIGAVVALFATACSSSSGNNSGAGKTTIGGGKPYVWGVATALSGPLAGYGTTAVSAVQGYAEATNKAGGINGKQIKVIALDTQEDPATVTVKATQLVTADHAQIVIGPILSASCQSAATVLKRYKVPLMCLLAADNLLKPAQHGIFTAGAPQVAVVPAVVGWLKHLGASYSKVALIGDANATNDEVVAGVKAGQGSGGFHVISTSTVDATAPDMNSQTTQALSKGATALVIYGTAPQGQSVEKVVQQQGAENVAVLYLEGDYNLSVMQTIHASNFYLFSSFKFADPTSTDTGVKAFVDAMSTQLSGTISQQQLYNATTAAFFLSANAVGAALKSCGASCSPDALSTAIESAHVSLPGLTDNYGFSTSSHAPQVDFNVSALVNGKLTLLQSFPG
jgi:ABC-type branched-subunit amino acid transport system substrate-binding protein